MNRLFAEQSTDSEALDLVCKAGDVSRKCGASQAVGEAVPGANHCRPCGDTLVRQGLVLRWKLWSRGSSQSTGDIIILFRSTVFCM